MPKEDVYDYYTDHAICYSKSGNTYLISFDADDNIQCDCVGFGYYKYCRHSDHVIKSGQLVRSKLEPIILTEAQQQMINKITGRR